jgi:membrane-bound lytic murein transglycosylase F
MESEGGGPLDCGYNYELINRFARSSGRVAHVRLAGRRESVLDSLRSGAIDLVAFPRRDSIALDTAFVQIRPDSSGVWVFPSSDQIQADKAAEWLKSFRESEKYPLVRQPFFDSYNPMKRVSADFISPYDSLLRVYADTLGWDWKLLAAVIYQESKFRIEARSPMGAAGLMQLLPGTARHFGCDDPLDPEKNIRAGVKMLLAVEKRYKRVAANPDELTKYTLAAYNAGTGRIRDCINYARHLGADVSKWENVAAVIPEMKRDSVAATGHLRHGPFHGGKETVSYVRKVRAYHERYRHICP